MRDISPARQAALAAAPDRGIVPRRLLWISARTRDTGATVEDGYWSGDEDMSFSVIDGRTGGAVTRPYRGAGELLQIGRIPRTSDFTVQSLDIDLSQIAPAVQQMVRGYDVRLARVEIHEIVLDTVSRISVDAPKPSFIGIVDDAPIETPAVGEQGSVRFTCRSDAMLMLTRTNPAKSSDAAQQLRSGDRFSRYAGVVQSWDIKWGPQG